MSYRHLFDNSGSWVAAQYQDLRYCDARINYLAFTAKGTVCLHRAAVAEHKCQYGQFADHNTLLANLAAATTPPTPVSFALANDVGLKVIQCCLLLRIIDDAGQCRIPIEHECHRRTTTTNQQVNAQPLVYIPRGPL